MGNEPFTYYPEYLIRVIDVPHDRLGGYSASQDHSGAKPSVATQVPPEMDHQGAVAGRGPRRCIIYHSDRRASLDGSGDSANCVASL